MTRTDLMAIAGGACAGFALGGGSFTGVVIGAAGILSALLLASRGPKRSGAIGRTTGVAVAFLVVGVLAGSVTATGLAGARPSRDVSRDAAFRERGVRVVAKIVNSTTTSTTVSNGTSVESLCGSITFTAEVDAAQREVRGERCDLDERTWRASNDAKGSTLPIVYLPGDVKSTRTAGNYRVDDYRYSSELEP